jgi:hypothetical protein
MIGTKGEKADQQEGSRQDYLSLPYNDPKRKALRGLEARYGAMYLAEAEARDQAGGLINGALAGALGLAGAAAGAALGLYTGGGLGGLIVGALEGAIGGAAAGTIVGGAITVHTRFMTPREWNAAAQVFSGSLPPRNQIILTDLIGLGEREFTVPGSSLSAVGAALSPALFAYLINNRNLFQGRTLVNMGRGYSDPLSYTRGKYTVPGQILMHELTHAWQIHQHSFTPGLICKGLYNQASNSLGGDVYGITDGKQWREYNLEQQGAIVDVWYANGQDMNHKYFRYIRDNVRTGSNGATSINTRTIGTTLSSTVRKY